MLEHLTFTEVILIFAPLIAMQISLAIYCIVNILKRGVGNLSKSLWLLIVIGFNFIGPIAYLLMGRRGKNERNLYQN